MKNLFPIALALTLLTIGADAQVSYNTTTIEVNKTGTVIVSDIHDDYMPVLQNLEMPETGNDGEEAYLQTLKQQVSAAYANKKFNPQEVTRGQAPDATLGNNFKANTYSNDPNDNNLAISNSGKLVSVSNTIFNMYDVSMDSLLKTISISSFDQSGKGGGFDPKTYYDPIADRFIIVYLSGSTSTATSIVIAFSQTNNPLGSWNFYSIPGNPLNNGTWSDYPAIASTPTEFFITVNMVQDGQTWQAGFKGSLIYQVNKKKAYAGAASLTMLRYDNIKLNNVLVRNLCPVKGGSTDHGPNLYLLSNKNLSVKNDTMFLLEVTDTIGAAGRALNVQMMLTPKQYHLAPNGRQSNNLPLTTNDLRVLGAFYENGIIQFVETALDTTTGFSAVLHGIVQNVSGTPSVSFNIIGDAVRDFGYPNISYAGKSSSDNSAIISFNHTAPTVFAGISAVYCDGNGSYSKVLTLQDGQGYISDFFGLVNPERWGDYSGSQRKYNEPGRVWVCGYHGSTGNASDTWVAEVVSPFSTASTKVNNKVMQASVYPNPTPEMFWLRFTLPEEQNMVFNIYDMKGILIKELMSTSGERGENVFHFSTSPLTPGIYIIKATGSKGAEFSARVVRK